LFHSKLKKGQFWGLVWRKEYRSGFCRSGHFGRCGVEKSVKQAFKTVRKRSEAFWSEKKRSGVKITVQKFFFA